MTRPPKSVLVRDAGIFMVKLWLDGLKDVVLTVAAVGAIAIDLFGRRRSDRYLFYRVVRYGERIDLWLNLYGAAGEGSESEEGMFAASRSGDKSFLGKLEEMTGGERPRNK
jgi:hypothetical protein